MFRVGPQKKGTILLIGGITLAKKKILRTESIQVQYRFVCSYKNKFLLKKCLKNLIIIFHLNLLIASTFHGASVRRSQQNHCTTVCSRVARKPREAKLKAAMRVARERSLLSTLRSPLRRSRGIQSAGWCACAKLSALRGR